MKTTSLLAAILAAGTLSAQSADKQLDARVMLFAEMVRPSAFLTYDGVKDQAPNQWGGGIRFMGELASAPGWYYELGGKFDSSSNLELKGKVTSDYYLDNTEIIVSHSYWSAGVAYLAMKGGFSLGFHLEARGEALGIRGQVWQKDKTQSAPVPKPPVADLNTTYLRPWGRISLDYTWKMGSTTPFAGVDASAALMKTDQIKAQDPSLMDTRTLRSLAPKGSVSVYGGFRF